MIMFVRLLPVVVACAVTQAFADDPPPKPVEPTKPASPPASATTPSTAPRIVLEDKTLTNEEVKQLLARGYKPVGRSGEVYYCRREQPVGSRINKMSCKTADQMKQIARDSKDMLADKQKAGTCGSGGC
jgi:hypothetical protein